MNHLDRIYFDHNASAAPRPEAVAAALACLQAGGNASSVHAEGRAARQRIETARRAVAGLVGAAPKNVVFTSGATEANVTALSPRLMSVGREVLATRLLVGAVEHPSVLRGGRFAASQVETVPVDADGVIRLDALARLVERAAAEGGRPLVALQLANNETGVIQPVRQAADIVHASGGWLHCDAVQAGGRVPIDIAALGADFLALSAHKLGGVPGAGALVLNSPDLAPVALLSGGGQEAYRRAGTENAAAIAAFGVAAEAALADLQRIAALGALRDWLEAELRTISNALVVFGSAVDRLPNTIACALPGMAAETAVIAFDLSGVALSSGSACSSGKVSASHVLKAMAVSEDLIRGGLRISLGWNTTKDEVERFAMIWQAVTTRLIGSAKGFAA